ncbi:TetR/AcrR family transcriptional regulator [Ammoniphilus resinae]|uniref:AcrR family transcriptional regulator n=1 Tax=Ammoniphilus resinae TaxID=861532 RepID=A0ABS4GWU9_9BACL|nr:TetR/AcrR family transcriptional regulator [Ammoniphilus resinae]MBP1934739.1 AcrR family transcriptional regulator [Ammoniphilus resinae]
MAKNKFQIKREETYEKLIKVGMGLLCEKGYSSTTIDDIASSAGYTKGAFYVHFKNKEDFFFHLLSYRLQIRKKWPESEEIGNQSFESLESAIRQRLETLFHYLIDNSGWIMVYIEFYHLSRSNANVRFRYREMLNQWVTEIEQFLHRLQEQGLLSTELDTLQAAHNIYAMLDGMLLHLSLYEEKIELERAVNMVMRMLH